MLLAEGQTVQPGDEVTFTVRLLAPAAAGTRLPGVAETSHSAEGRALPDPQRDIQGPRGRVRPEVELYPSPNATSRVRDVAFGRR